MAAKSTITGLTITIGADTKQFSKALKDIDAEARNIAKDLKTVNEYLKIDPTNTQKEATALKLLQDEAGKAGEKVKLINEAISKLNKEYQSGKVSSEDYSSSLERLNVMLSQARNEQDLANEKIRQFGQETKTAEKGALSLGDIIKANLISGAVLGGMKTLANLAKSIASALWNGVKNIASATWNFTKDSMNIAEENRQTLAKVGQVFGESKKEVVDWSKSAVTAMGLTKGEAQTAAATFGNMFTALEVADDEAAKMSTDLVQLAADVGAFNNVTTASVLENFQSGLAGTSRQLREYGIVITAAMVEEKALAMGLAETSDDLTEGNKIVARYALMMEQAAKQTGQFARESDSATVQSQVFHARIKELQGEIGERLIPVQARLYEELNDFLASEEGQEFFNTLTDSVGDLADEIIELMNSGKLSEWIESIKEKMPGFIDDIKTTGKEIKELLPEIEKLVENVLAFFGIETDSKKKARETKEAFESIKKDMNELAESFGLNTESMQSAILQFAEENGISVKQISEDWSTYAPKIAGWLNTMKSDYHEELINGAYGFIQKFAEDNLLSLQDVLNNWAYFEPEIIKHATELDRKYGTEFTETIGFIKDFAAQNNTTLGEILTNWTHWEPLITQSMDTLTTNTENTQKAYDEQIKKLPESTQEALSDTQEKINSANSIDLSPLRTLASKVWEVVTNIVKGVDYAGNSVNDGPWQQQKDWKNNFQLNSPILSGNSYAEGGYTPAGRFLRVNDDAGHRLEGFIPLTDGIVTNGNQTEKIMNNINNSRNISGGINLYVQSYGMNVAEVAEELAVAFNNAIRIPGNAL